MSAKRGREASDQAAWRRRGKAFARLLESVEFHRVDWRESGHMRKALEEVDSLPHPELELYMGVEIAAGWLAHLIREFALDECTTPRQMQLVIGTARGIIENGGFAWAAQQIIGRRGVQLLESEFKPKADELSAFKQAKKDRTWQANEANRALSAMVDEIILKHSCKYITDDGWARGTAGKIEKVVNKDIDKLNAERRTAHEFEMAGLAPNKRKKFVSIDNVGVSAISKRLNAFLDERTSVLEKTRMSVRTSLN